MPATVNPELGNSALPAGPHVVVQFSPEAQHLVAEKLVSAKCSIGFTSEMGLTSLLVLSRAEHDFPSWLMLKAFEFSDGRR